MMTAIRQTVHIEPGGKIEIVSPDLPVGEEAEVIVLVREVAQPHAGQGSECAAPPPAELERRRRTLQRIQELAAPFAAVFKGTRFTREELHDRR